MSKTEDNEVIATGIGYPYDVIQKGYPNKIADSKINETIEKILSHMRGNAGVAGIVTRDSAFINIGLNELNNRKNSKQSKIAFILSIVSIIIALGAFAISIYSIYSGDLMQGKQIDILSSINENIQK